MANSKSEVIISSQMHSIDHVNVQMVHRIGEFRANQTVVLQQDDEGLLQRNSQHLSIGSLYSIDNLLHSCSTAALLTVPPINSLPDAATLLFSSQIAATKFRLHSCSSTAPSTVPPVDSLSTDAALSNTFQAVAAVLTNFCSPLYHSTSRLLIQR